MPKTVTRTYKASEIDGAILGIAKRAETLKQSIHNVAAAIIAEWSNASAAKKISDDAAMDAAKVAADRLNRLQAASPYHANAFAKWVGMMLPLSWSDENKSWYAKTEACRLMGADMIKARDLPFWEVSPPAAPKPFIMYEELRRIYSRYVKHIEKKVDGDQMDAEAAKLLQQAMTVLEEKGLKPATTE